MKKLTISIILILLGVMVSTAYASAASVLQFSPISVSTNPGKTFTLTVTLDPYGVKNYTSKMEIDFPADILKVNSFTFGDGWLPLSVSGYDLVDNTNGTLIKSAGYPGGVLNPITFGTISFTAKKEGNGKITLTGNSFVLNATSQNILSSSPMQEQVVIKAVQTTIPKTTPKTNQQVITPAPTSNPETVTPTPIFDINAKPVLPVKQSVIPLIISIVAEILFILLVVFIARWIWIFVVERRRRKKERNIKK